MKSGKNFGLLFFWNPNAIVLDSKNISFFFFCVGNMNNGVFISFKF